MRLIITGCEYAGKSTLVHELLAWGKTAMGHMAGVHDHFDYPPNELPEEDWEKLMALSSKTKELFQRHMFAYHHRTVFMNRPDHILVGYHIQEMVYAPLYYGYVPQNRLARDLEREIMESAPDIVLILMKADPDAIRERMKTSPHSRQIVKEDDVEMLLERFEEEFRASMLRRHFELDTTNTGVADTFSEFLENMKPHFSQMDMLRMLTHGYRND
jgi:hypothetical protein